MFWEEDDDEADTPPPSCRGIDECSVLADECSWFFLLLRPVEEEDSRDVLFLAEDDVAWRDMQRLSNSLLVGRDSAFLE